MYLGDKILVFVYVVSWSTAIAIIFLSFKGF